MRVRSWPRAYAFAGLVACAILLAGFAGGHHLQATVLVLHTAGASGVTGVVPDWLHGAVAEEETTFRSRHGELRARIYSPAIHDRVIVLIPGVQPAGIDDPRVRQLARGLAVTRTVVITPDLPDLRAFRILPSTTDLIEDAVLWGSEIAALNGKRPMGIVAASFAGGLSIVAAGRPSLQDRVAFVVSVGGHGDLARVLRYLCGDTPPGENDHAPPHDYGLAITLLNLADRLVPAEHAVPLQNALLSFLHASHAVTLGDPDAGARLEQVAGEVRDLPDPARRLMELVLSRDVATLGSMLRPHVVDLELDPALSPEQSPPPAAAVYLLHGAHDDVIPALESTRLAGYLRAATRVEHLISPLISHADVHLSAAAVEAWRLVAWVARWLRE